MSWNSKEEWNKAKELFCEEQIVVVYDLETTGLSPANNRFIEIGAIRYHVKENGLVWEKIDEMSMLINPQVLLPEKIVEITGITDADLADKPTETEIFEQVREFFGDYVVAGYNNIRFDDKFFAEYFARQGTRFAPRGSLDGYLLAKQSDLYKDLENCKLITIGKYYGLDFTAHRALGDVQTTAEIIRLMLIEYSTAKPASTVPAEAIKATVIKVAYWEGFRGFSRIYVETTAGNVYYDLRSTLWGEKDVKIDTLDMADVQAQALTLVGASSMEDFTKFRSSVKA